jgi:acetyl-CoA acyltransferase 1
MFTSIGWMHAALSCKAKRYCRAWHADRFIPAARRQCSSGLQAVASVAASIQAGYYDIGLAGGVESMSTNPMAWDGGVNPKIADNQKAQDCLLPMGELLSSLI